MILICGEAKSVGSTSALSRLNMKVAFAWILASSLVRPTLTTRSESFELHVCVQYIIHACVYECRVERREMGGKREGVEGKDASRPGDIVHHGEPYSR